MSEYRTKQESFWAGNFGDEYVERNQSRELLASNLHFFSKVLSDAVKVESTFEVGCNVGMNMRALKLLLPNADHTGIEINKKAYDLCSQTLKDCTLFHGSILDFETEKKHALVFSKGVLIHLDPVYLPLVYEKMAKMSSKYVLIAEYFNPTPVSIDYRGNTDKLFKRDFAKEFLSVNKDFILKSYSFHYKEDHNFSQDNITWFLLERVC